MEKKKQSHKSMVPAPNAKGQFKSSAKPFSRRGRKESRGAEKGFDGTFTVSHREYVGDVKAEQGFMLRINPGNSALFPWLSKIACNYDKYQIKRLALCYVPTCCETVNGSIAMCIDLDPADPISYDKRTMFGAAGTVRAQPFKPARLTVPKNDLKAGGLKFVTGSEEKEPRTADYGFFVVKPFDIVYPTSYGEMWVEYKITFSNPQLCAPTPPAGSLIMSNAPKPEMVFAESTVQGPQLCTVDPKTGAIQCPSPGDYLLTVEVEGDAISEPPIVQSAGAGITPMDIIIDGPMRRGLFTYCVSALSAFTVLVSMAARAKLLRMARATFTPFFHAYNPD